MTMTQMNIRIDDDVRMQGNLALKQIGLTPSRAIRNLWAFAAQHKNEPAKLKHDLAFLDEDRNSDDERRQRIAKAQEGSLIVRNGLAALGVTVPTIDTTPYEELKERAYREYWEEKGLL